MLGLPWDAWGETDVLLAMCRRSVEASTCQCGCGQSAETCLDRATDGRWQVVVETCYAGAALANYQEKHGDKLPAGALVGVRLLAEGEPHHDPMQRSIEGDRDEYERLRAKRSG